MKTQNKTRYLILAITALALFTTGSLFAASANISGNWKAKTVSAQGSAEQTITFNQNGDAFTGEMTTSQGTKESVKDGKVIGDDIEFNVERKRPNGEVSMVAYKGKVTGNQIAGTFVGATGRNIEWTATKE
jgi:hypothetical protein